MVIFVWPIVPGAFFLKMEADFGGGFQYGGGFRGQISIWRRIPEAINVDIGTSSLSIIVERGSRRAAAILTTGLVGIHLGVPNYASLQWRQEICRLLQCLSAHHCSIQRNSGDQDAGLTQQSSIARKVNWTSYNDISRKGQQQL